MSARRVAPRDCLLAVAMPETAAEFAADLRSRPDGLAASLCRQRPAAAAAVVFEAALRPSLALLDDVAAELQRLGGTVLRRVDLPSWRNLFHRAEQVPAVVTLVAHGTGAAVELRDGLHPAASLAAALPPQLDGYFDLTSCHSIEALADALKRRAPGITVQSTRGTTLLGVRLALYRQVIRRLAARPASYMTTVVDVWSDAAK
ncbi:MAG: hypothetical protein AB7O97_06050 [Planctomycetota bacterium]